MRSLTAFLFILFIFSGAPEWVKNQGKSSQFPDVFYLTGYGIGTVANGVTKEQAEEKSLENARKNLIEKIRVTIQSVTSSRIEEIGDKYSSLFSSAVQSTSDLEIEGLNTEKYFDDGIAYAFVYVKRDQLQDEYQQKVKDLNDKISGNVKIAKAYEQENKLTQALEEYVGCYPLLRQLEEAQSILASLKVGSVLTELESEGAQNETAIAEVRESIAKLVRRPLNSVDDVAWYLAYILKEQVDQKQPTSFSVSILPLVYEDTRIGSSFSRYFNQVLEQKCSEVAKWDIRQERAANVLTGSYWEQNDKTKFIVSVRAISGGAIIGSAEATVDTKVLESTGRSLKPENFSAALADQKVFASDELTGGGLSLEAWTNKENEGNLFVEKERMKVFVRVNMPCYIRFIYHMADGKRVLLMDEYYIDQSKVNLVYPIPTEFECASPFGSETLQIFARTDHFEHVQTESINGYDYLKEDLQKFVGTTRGMKIAKPKTLQAEKRIQVTTMQD